MSNDEIILISAILATTTMIAFKMIINIIRNIQYSKLAKDSKARMKELEELEKEGKIQTTIIDLGSEKYRVRNPADFNGIIIDREKYNDLTSWFIKKSEALYVIGKQENYIIKLLITKE